MLKNINFCKGHLQCVRNLRILRYWMKLLLLYATDLLDTAELPMHRLFVTNCHLHCVVSFALCRVHVKVCSSPEKLTVEI